MPTSAYKIEISKRDQQIAELLQRNQELEEENKELEEENKRLKQLLHNKGKSKESKKPEFKIDYSVNQNQAKRKRRHKSTGRRRQEQKLNQVSAEEAVYLPTVKPECCQPLREQYAWRIRSGKAEYVRYTLYGLESPPELPKVPGLRNSRSEYGLEIILIVAFLHYWIGISLDNVCDVLCFFTGLSLPKSQADSLLNQLSQYWSDQYDTIAGACHKQEHSKSKFQAGSMA